MIKLNKNLMLKDEIKKNRQKTQIPKEIQISY
jgi:hypothetical protein